MFFRLRNRDRERSSSGLHRCDGKRNKKEKVTYQNQCPALGDGKTYNKLEQNPVITGDMLPEHFSREHFRDPKIWKEADGIRFACDGKAVVNIQKYDIVVD